MLRLPLILGALILANLSLDAAPERAAVTGVPRILGSEIPRFVLMERMRVDRSGPGMSYSDLHDRMVCDVLPGQFVAGSQDAGSVYYQGSNGIQNLISKAVVHGGLRVSKTKAQTIHVYEGDARLHEANLKVDTLRLSKDQMRKLKLGKSASQQ